jgi:micrococcal nuclease
VSKPARRSAPPARKPADSATKATIALVVALVAVLIAIAFWMARDKPTPPPAPPVASEAMPPVVTATEPRRPPPPPRPREPEPEPEVAPEPEPEPEPTPPAPEFATAWVRGQTEQVTVKRAVDGDTVELSDGRRIRLVGINTPEREEPLYAEAKAALKELVEGAQVTLEFDRERTDQYQRTLAYMFKGEMFVNGEIVRRGLAYCYTWEPNVAHRDEFLGFQRQARVARAGLWSLPPPSPESSYIADENGHRFHRPSCGRVGRIRKKLEYATREAALDEGQNPCNECRP